MLENLNYSDCPCGACQDRVRIFIETMRYAVEHPDEPIYWVQTYHGLEPRMSEAHRKADANCVGGKYLVNVKDAVAA